MVGVPPYVKSEMPWIYNLGYVFPESILRKWRQYVENGRGTLVPYEMKMAASDVSPEDFEYTPPGLLIDDPSEKLAAFDIADLPEHVRPLCGMRKYIPRPEILDLIRCRA
jgi:hypothetical protein